MQSQTNIVFVALNENVLFTSRSASNIMNGIAFLKLQNFVSVLYVILINFKKCNKRADNFCLKTCFGSLSVLHLWCLAILSVSHNCIFEHVRLIMIQFNF